MLPLRQQQCRHAALLSWLTTQRQLSLVRRTSAALTRLHQPLRQPQPLVLVASATLLPVRTSVQHALTQHRFYSQEKLPKEVMLIDETGTNVGIVPGQDAKLKADLLGLAVSIVAPNAKPPVARIFSKQDLSAMKAKAFEAEQQKRKEARAKRTLAALPSKEVQMTGWVEEHDFLTKMKQMNKFLAKGNQVKLFIKHKRGQSRDRDQQKNLIARIQDSVRSHGKLDGNPKVTDMIRANSSSTMDPKKEAKRLKAEEKKRAKEQKAAEKRAEKAKKAQEKLEAKLKKKGVSAETAASSETQASSTVSSNPAADVEATLSATEETVDSPSSVIPQTEAVAETAASVEATQPSAVSPEATDPVPPAPTVAAATSDSGELKREKPAEASVSQEAEPTVPSVEASEPIMEENSEPIMEENSEPIMEENSVPPPSVALMEDKPSDGQAVPAVAPRPFPRLNSRQSVRGAPAQLLPNQSASRPASEAVVEMEETPMVEEEADGRVGQMTTDNAMATSGFLKKAIEHLRGRMLELWDQGTNTGYHYAYEAMADVGRDQASEASFSEPNRLKNRYGNIVAYDAHRVKLPVREGDASTDYINASWVDAYQHPNGYIASQGPVPNSFVDFWSMVWEFKICSIVMVTHEVEKGRMKCHRYWPDPSSSPPTQYLTYGDVTVLHVSTVPHRHFLVRTFLVTRDGEERTIKQFAYTSWPDHGVPLTTAELLGFRNAVNENTPKKDVPILIHCSAGVGRTGTYIAIDTLVKQSLDMAALPEVDTIINELRMRRNYMVQTEMQYIFIYRAVYDCLGELLREESSKAGIADMDEETQRELLAAAAEAAKAKQEDDAKEEAAIAEARKILEQEALARTETSAANAKAVVTMSLDKRKQMLDDAEERWLANYQLSLAEWNERNQFAAEVYDVSSKLTPVQSRLAALKQKGLLD